MERLTQRTLLIDVHAMPVLKELAAYLVIERLVQGNGAVAGQSCRENDRRTIRTILVIDEAHNYLSQRNLFLQRHYPRRPLQRRCGVFRLTIAK
jgi:DNA sulfur modification protein DndE